MGLIQRLIEILRSFPSIPLWMALAAAMPATWSPVAVYFCMTVILALIGWTGLARVVRGPHRLPIGGCSHAAIVADRIYAQPFAHGQCKLSVQTLGHKLAPGRGLVCQAFE